MQRERTALAVMRCQPFHRGHAMIINRMIEDYQTVIIGIGSTGRHSEPSNPWTQIQRQEMLRNVYGNRIRIIPLQDIGTEQGSNDWCDYVLQKCLTMKLPPITDYLTGSHADATWYRGRFLLDGDPVRSLKPYVVDPNEEPKDDNIRRLHILDRNSNPVPSATELRTYLATRSDEWKRWVPGVNHKLVEETYPEEFRVRVS